MSSNCTGASPTLPLALASAALLLAGAAVGCGDSLTGPSSVEDIQTSAAVEVRNFSGLVELPTPTTMDLTLRIQRQSADATPLLPEFFATLLAQETTSQVSGTFTVGTVPPTGGTVEGTITSLSSLTAAGQFDGVFIEDSGNCTARQQYVGPITATGINLAAGNTLQPVSVRITRCTLLGRPHVQWYGDRAGSRPRLRLHFDSRTRRQRRRDCYLESSRYQLWQ